MAGMNMNPQMGQAMEEFRKNSVKVDKACPRAVPYRMAEW